MGAGELADGELTPDDADAFGRAVAELSLAVAMSRSCWLDAGELPDSKNYDCILEISIEATGKKVSPDF